MKVPEGLESWGPPLQSNRVESLQQSPFCIIPLHVFGYIPSTLHNKPLGAATIYCHPTTLCNFRCCDWSSRI